MDDNKKQGVLIWSILGINILTLVIMSAVAYIGWGIMNSKIDEQQMSNQFQKEKAPFNSLVGSQIGTTTQQAEVDCDLNKDGKIDSVENAMCEKIINKQAPTGDGVSAKCGDGVCDTFEKANLKICPTDCK